MRMEPDFSTDVCIIGGGPSGSTIAKRLADLQYHVLLVEKTVFPRPHVGICLSEQTNALLDYLGVLKEMEKAAFWKRSQTLVKWNTDIPIIANQPGMHVDRGRFDEILLENVQAAGVKILQSTRTTSIRRGLDQGWEIQIDSDNKRKSIHARFIVDASGRANALKDNYIRYAPPLIALHADWKLKSEPICDGLMEAGKSAWLWIAYLGNHQAMISLYTDPKQISESGKSIENFYLDSLQHFSEVKKFNLESIIGEVLGCDASSRYSNNLVEKDFIKVGDASLSVDPMASQGVHLAISSSLQAAIVVNTLLKNPNNAHLALDFYHNSQSGRINQFKKRTAYEYSRAAKQWTELFWQDRAKDAPDKEQNPKFISKPSPDQIVRLCPKAQFVMTPVLQEDFIDSELALHHYKLDKPIAYIGGKRIVPLLQKIKKTQSVAEVIDGWKTEEISNDLGKQILQWLWKRRILI